MNEPTKSKINWTAAAISAVTLGLVAMGATPEVKANVLTLVGIFVPPLIIVFRTWFTGPK